MGSTHSYENREQASVTVMRYEAVLCISVVERKNKSNFACWYETKLTKMSTVYVSKHCQTIPYEICRQNNLIVKKVISAQN